MNQAENDEKTGTSMKIIPDDNHGPSEFCKYIIEGLFERMGSTKTSDISVEEFESVCLKASKGRRILLISPTGWQKVSVNLGLALLAGSLKACGFDVLVLDLCYTPMSDEMLKKKVNSFCPFIVGVSAKTAQAKEAVRLAGLLRETSESSPAFVVGGPHVTLASDFFFKPDRKVFDFGVMSEGEISFTSLAVALAMDESELSCRIDGVVYPNKKTREVVVNPWEPPENLSLLPYPDFESIHGFKFDKFCYPIVSSRGCPYSCIYCCVNLLTGSKKWRARTPENIVEELTLVKEKFGVDQFEFWDDNFTLDMKRAKKFCRLLIDSGLSFSWWCHNGIRADKIDEELAGLMRAAGCTSVAFGIESGTPRVFDSIQKGEKLDDCVRAVQLLKNAGIKAVGYFIIGLPEDTLNSFIETVRFQRSLDLDHYTFGLLVPYPGTKVWDIVQDDGRFLQDVTDSQHFSSDLPEISFELENFPPRDITTAYYISRFFELYESVEKILDQKGQCDVTFLLDESDGVRGAIGLFYSLLPFKDKINITLFFDKLLNTSLDDENFRSIAESFEHKAICAEGELLKRLEKTDIAVSSINLTSIVSHSGVNDKYTLQLSNPIEALIRF